MTYEAKIRKNRINSHSLGVCTSPVTGRPAGRGDLRCGLKRPDTGRKGLTAQQVLRSLILMRVKNWDYRDKRGAAPSRLHDY